MIIPGIEVTVSLIDSMALCGSTIVPVRSRSMISPVCLAEFDITRGVEDVANIEFSLDRIFKLSCGVEAD